MGNRAENEIEAYLPFWKQLSQPQQEKILREAVLKTAKKGEIIHRGNADCLGFVIVKCGQLRAFVTSGEGKEITVYRMFERDLCLLAASCIFRTIDFEIWMEAREETIYWVIPPYAYQELMDTSLSVMKYTNELMAERFSDVMWTMEQILGKSVDKRLAAFLIEEAKNSGKMEFSLTHDRAARELGLQGRSSPACCDIFSRRGLCFYPEVRFASSTKSGSTNWPGTVYAKRICW